MPKLKTEQLKSKVIFTGTAAELLQFLTNNPEIQKKKIKIIEKAKEVPK